MKHLNNTLLASTAAALAVGFASEPAAGGAAKAPAAPRVEPVLTSAFKIDLPERKSARGSVSVYAAQFEALEVGASFGVKNKTAAQLSSIISNANRKYRTPVKDANGNPMFETKTLSDGNGGSMDVPDTTKPKTEQTRHFIALDVTPDLAKALKGTAGEGAKALISRDK